MWDDTKDACMSQRSATGCRGGRIRDLLIRVKQRLLGTGAMSRSVRDLDMIVCI